MPDARRHRKLELGMYFGIDYEKPRISYRRISNTNPKMTRATFRAHHLSPTWTFHACAVLACTLKKRLHPS